MQSLNLEKSIANLATLNSVVTQTTASINEQFSTAGELINSSLVLNTTNAINTVIILEQSAINSCINIGAAFTQMLGNINTNIINTQILSDIAFYTLANNAILYTTTAFSTIITGMTAFSASMAVIFMNIWEDTRGRFSCVDKKS